MDRGGGRDLALQRGTVGQRNAHGDGRLRSAVVQRPAGAVEDIAGQVDIIKGVLAGLAASGSGALGGPAGVLVMSGVEGEGSHIHAGGGVVVVHGLDQDTVAGVQLSAVGDDRIHAAAGLMKDGSIAGIDHGALGDGQLIGGQTGVLMHHEAEGVGVDGSDLGSGGHIVGDLIAQRIIERNGLAGLHGGIGSITAGHNIGIGADVHIDAIEVLVCLTDGIGAIAGTGGIGVSGIEDAVRLEGLITHALQGHGGIDHVQHHIGTGVGGQHSPLGGRHVGIDYGGAGVIAHQVGSTGGAHNTEDPGRSHHGGLIGGIAITGIQRAAAGEEIGVLDVNIGALIRIQRQVANAGDVDVRIFDFHVALAIGRNSRAIAGEVAGNRAVAVAVDVDSGTVDGVVGVAHNDGVKPLIGGANNYIFCLRIRNDTVRRRNHLIGDLDAGGAFSCG